MRSQPAVATLAYHLLMPERRKLYKITFHNQGQVYEIYAKHVNQGGLLGFVEVEQLVFGEKTQLVVDPGEERLRHEFEGVKRTYIPMHAVIRIDEVDKEGASRITEVAEKDNVAAFPMPLFKPGKDSPR